MSIALPIEEGLRAMAIDLSSSDRDRLAAHLGLIEKWNRVHNLTAVREPQQMVILHLLDSLSLLPHLGEAETMIDIGAGPGFPGIPVAIARPEMRVTLLDSSHKKCAFLEQAKADLALANVEVVCERVEQFKSGRRFDIVVSRAFGDLSDFVTLSQHLVAPGGRLLAMKGVYPFEELARVPASHRVAEVIELAVPNLQAKRHLILLEAA